VVKSLPAPEPKKNPYLIELIAVGFFEVNSDWPDPIKLLEINGATILYSAAREFLITITSRGPWGAIPLPATSFLALYNHKISARQQKEGDSAKGEKVKTQESKTPKS
jgi:preprotein translocase subunit SecB